MRGENPLRVGWGGIAEPEGNHAQKWKRAAGRLFQFYIPAFFRMANSAGALSVG
jgi:hypothetical protein